MEELRRIQEAALNEEVDALDLGAAENYKSTVIVNRW